MECVCVQRVCLYFQRLNCLCFALFFSPIGLYLYMLVVETFSGDNLKFNLYALIGWGKWSY